jgi:DNA-binding transcriptional regulator YiaG
MTSEQLKALRQRANLTQVALAKLVGAGSYRTVQNWEAGIRKIPGPVVKLLEQLEKKQD